jgi:hypothetical protein
MKLGHMNLQKSGAKTDAEQTVACSKNLLEPRNTNLTIKTWYSYYDHCCWYCFY